ncbi:hypothetical protein FQA47_023369 [Oryzias melastigma]|uniref:Uncharacterized protein n=1 Tax=Oryzias melastigma TaxID=30732 RepID=A0A834CEP1_ORYME|nr:hypothetical protein FQA47_023369 [Oryzias melastigma]
MVSAGHGGSVWDMEDRSGSVRDMEDRGSRRSGVRRSGVTCLKVSGAGRQDTLSSESHRSVVVLLSSDPVLANRTRSVFMEGPPPPLHDAPMGSIMTVLPPVSP